MKATKKIVGAACALVAAVALSAGSTFAWFASNNEVSVTNMKVQATVPANLYIKEGYVTEIKNVNATTIDFNDSAAASLSPIALSTAALEGEGGNTLPTSGTPLASGSLTNGKLYAINAKTYESDKDPSSGSAGTAATYELIASGEASSSSMTFNGAQKGESDSYEPKEYVYAQDMTLANKSNPVNIKATVSLKLTDGSTTDTFLFIRTGFVVGTFNESTWSYEYVSLENVLTKSEGSVSGATDNVAYANNIVTFTYNDLIKNFETNSVRTVTFVVWFDGNDTDCYVDNAITVDQFTVSINYTAGDVEKTEVTP